MESWAGVSLKLQLVSYCEVVQWLQQRPAGAVMVTRAITEVHTVQQVTPARRRVRDDLGDLPSEELISRAVVPVNIKRPDLRPYAMYYAHTGPLITRDSRLLVDLHRCLPLSSAPRHVTRHIRPGSDHVA